MKNKMGLDYMNKINIFKSFYKKEEKRCSIIGLMIDI